MLRVQTWLWHLILLLRRGLMHAEYTAHPTNRSIFHVNASNGTVSIRVLFSLSPRSLLTPPSLFLSPPLPPSIQPDGLPLTEQWHQMCSSSVDSGTSWAECASGSVNENGSAMCVCVCVVYCGSVACDSWGNSLWVRVSRVSHSELHCSSTQPCSAQQHTHQGWNYTATHPE